MLSKSTNTLRFSPPLEGLGEAAILLLFLVNHHMTRVTCHVSRDDILYAALKK
jgi:hypothetical protein